MPLFSERLPPNHPNLATLHHTIGVWSVEVGRPQCALLHEGRAIEIYREVLPAGHSHLGDALNGLGPALLAVGDVEAARTALQEADQIYVDAHGPESWRRMASIGNLGSVALFEGDHESAERLYRQKIGVVRTLPDNPANRRNLSATLRLLVAQQRLEALNRNEAPAPTLDTLLDEAEKLLEGIDRPRETAAVDLLRASLAAQRGEANRARALLAQAESMVGDPAKLDAPATFVVRAQVPALLGETGRALELLNQAIESDDISRWLVRDPTLTAVLSDPKAAGLTRRLGERLEDTSSCVMRRE